MTMELTRADQYKSKRRKIIDFLTANPDMYYKTIAEAVGVKPVYVSQVKSDLRSRGGLPRGRGTYARTEPPPAIACETQITPWFIDMHGIRTRIATGVPVARPVVLGRPPT